MMKDPFEAALEEEHSPPESPVPPDDEPLADDEDADVVSHPPSTSAFTPTSVSAAGGGGGRGGTGRGKEEDEDEDDEENMDVELGRVASGDPDKMAKMKAILSQFTEEQMSRYESFRRSGFQKSNMKRNITAPFALFFVIIQTYLVTASGECNWKPKNIHAMTIVVSGIAKMFVGELVETARVVMAERKDAGPIRPCHIREAYRRLKLEGKVPRRSVPRLFC